MPASCCDGVGASPLFPNTNLLDLTSPNAPADTQRSGFFRNQQPLFVKVFDFATNDIFHVAETVDGGGDCLVRFPQHAALQ